MVHNLRILIVGGVAGGASCAARARRLSESAEITMFDRGPYVSFANCGLPYYAGDVIKKEENLLIATTELCYAPQFGSAKDPVNLAGMIAANVVRGDITLAHWEDIHGTDALILDVRTPDEFKRDHVEGALNIQLDEIRTRMNELPKKREIWTYCYVGQRSYYATRALVQYGFKVKNISGGFKTFLLHESSRYLG